MLTAADAFSPAGSEVLLVAPDRQPDLVLIPHSTAVVEKGNGNTIRKTRISRCEWSIRLLVDIKTT
jgi:hypothetical protein